MPSAEPRFTFLKESSVGAMRSGLAGCNIAENIRGDFDSAALGQERTFGFLVAQHSHNLGQQYVKGLAEIHLLCIGLRFLASNVHVQNSISYVFHGIS